MERTTSILIVDDDRVSRSVAILALQEAGEYRLLEASNAAEGRAIAHRERPALIITDHYMPGEDGMAFCQNIKSDPDLGDTMVMMLTSASETRLKVKGFDRGADEYMTKPYDTAEFISRVRALLRLKMLQEELKLDNAELERLNGTLNQNLDGVMNLLVHIIGLRVPNASARAEKACRMCRWIGSRMGFEQDELDLVDMAARIHEIGKIVMPDELLSRREDELSREERDAFLQFPVFGQMLVGKIPQLKRVGSAIRHQLENFDGTGIPDKLRREEIPRLARVLRVVAILEAQDATRSPSPDQVLELLHKSRGTLLDPHIGLLAEEYLRVVEDPTWLEGKLQIPIDTLREGMVIAGDLCTANGTKLLPEGCRLTGSHVARILEHHRVDPVVTGVYVYVTA